MSVRERFTGIKRIMTKSPKQNSRPFLLASAKMVRCDAFGQKMNGGVLWQKIKKEIDVTVIEVTEEYLKEKLYKIRGKRVLLDADLAEIYGYDTKGFNSR